MLGSDCIVINVLEAERLIKAIRALRPESMTPSDFYASLRRADALAAFSTLDDDVKEYHRRAVEGARGGE